MVAFSGHVELDLEHGTLLQKLFAPQPSVRIKSKRTALAVTGQARSKHQSSLPQLALPQGKKKHMNINKFAGLSRDWVGAKNLFMCLFSGHSLWGKNTHTNKVPQKIPGQSREIFVYVFFSLCVFFAPNFHPLSPLSLVYQKSQRFRKGVGGRELATNDPSKQPQKNSPVVCPPSPKGA